jgi:hypothetical protein
MGKFPQLGDSSTAKTTPSIPWKFLLFSGFSALFLFVADAVALSLREGLTGRTGLAFETGLAKPTLTEKADAWTVSFPKGFLVKRDVYNQMLAFHYFRSESRWAETEGAGDGAGFTFAARDDADRLTNHFFVLSMEHPVKSFWKFDNYLTFGLGLNSWKMTDVNGNVKQLEDLNGRMFDARDDRIILAVGAGGEIFFSDYIALDVGGDLYYNTKILSQFQGDRNIKNKNSYGLFNALTSLHTRLNFYFGRQRDTDGDGVPDKRDACGNNRPGEVVDADGCTLDKDADGIPDWLDLCAKTPYGTRVDGDGCPLTHSSTEP